MLPRIENVAIIIISIIIIIIIKSVHYQSGDPQLRRQKEQMQERVLPSRRPVAVQREGPKARMRVTVPAMRSRAQRRTKSKSVFYRAGDLQPCRDKEQKQERVLPIRRVPPIKRQWRESGGPRDACALCARRGLSGLPQGRDPVQEGDGLPFAPRVKYHIDRPLLIIGGTKEL